MIRRRRSTAHFLATTFALLLGAATLFALIAPLVGVPVAVLLEPMFGDQEFADARAGATFYFGFFWIGIWMAMAFLPGAGFAVAGWLPFWLGAAKSGKIGRWWIGILWGMVTGFLAVAVFLIAEGFMGIPDGGKWGNAAILGGLAGGAVAGALVCLMSCWLLPGQAKAAVIPEIPGRRPVPAPAIVPPVSLPDPVPISKPVQQLETVPEPEPAPAVKPVIVPEKKDVKKRKGKEEPLKWTDWGKVWKPPEEE